MEHSEEILTAQRMSLKILQLYIKISKAFKLLEKLIKWSHFTLCKECDISEVCNFRCPLSYVPHHDYT